MKLSKFFPQISFQKIELVRIIDDPIALFYRIRLEMASRWLVKHLFIVINCMADWLQFEIFKFENRKASFDGVS